MKMRVTWQGKVHEVVYLNRIYRQAIIRDRGCAFEVNTDELVFDKTRGQRVPKYMIYDAAPLRYFGVEPVRKAA